jgi:hypothetical protein
VSKLSRPNLASGPATLRFLIAQHAVDNPGILDASYNEGKMWIGIESGYNLTRLDKDPWPKVDVVGNWNDLPMLFGDRRFDVIVWDPPYLTDAGKGLAGKGAYGKQYGTSDDELKGKPNIAFMFAPFLAAAKAVLQPKTGIIVTKISDAVHDNARQWQHHKFVAAGIEAGFTACEEVPTHPPSLDTALWKRRYHIDSATYWYVLRNGKECRGPGVGVVCVCVVCNRGFKAHKQATTCSDAHRTKLYRQRRAAAA